MDGIEKGGFLKLFNRGGYVLDFSTNDFDTFTMEREQGYKYPHEYPNHWVEQQYLLPNVQG